MPFCSIDFAIFLPIALCVSLLLHDHEQNILVPAAGSVFYPPWNRRSLIPQLLSASVEVRAHWHDRNIGKWCAESTRMIALRDEIEFMPRTSHDVRHPKEYRVLTNGKS